MARKRATPQLTGVPAETAVDELLRDAEAAQAVFRTDDGKRLLRYLHKKVGQRSTFVPGDIYATCVREGMRVLYLHLVWLAHLASTDIKARMESIADQPIWEQTREIDPDDLVEGDYTN